jgi:hypothetical protein
VDSDQDGLLDLFIINGRSDECLYRQAVGGTYVKLTAVQVGSVLRDAGTERPPSSLRPLALAEADLLAQGLESGTILQRVPRRGGAQAAEVRVDQAF